MNSRAMSNFSACMRHAVPAFIAFAWVLLLSADAHATNYLNCTNGAPVGGTSLFDTSATCSGMTGIQNIFSGLVCDFEAVLDAILSRVYCGIQYQMLTTLTSLAVLYVVLIGVTMALGTIELSVGEIFWRFLKLILIIIFATNATYGIGIFYRFFNAAAKDGINWVLGIVPASAGLGGSGEYDAFIFMDSYVYGVITGPMSVNGYKLAGFVSMLSYVVPPLFIMFLYFFIKSLSIFIRALLSYLLGISAIAFLISMAPIFMSFALFQVTYRYFESWLRYIISFTLQIVLIFAAFGVWIYVMSLLGNFFVQLAGIVWPYPGAGVGEAWVFGAPRLPQQTWGVCPFTTTNGPWGPQLTCTGAPVVPPSMILNSPDFIFFVAINIIVLTIAAYAFDVLMRNIPDIARQLSGPKYAPQLGGGLGTGAVDFGKLTGTGGQQAVKSFLNTKGGFTQKLKAGMSSAVGNRTGPQGSK